jgi:adenylate cyclase
MGRIIQKALTKQLQYTPPKIKNSEDYVKKRIDTIRAFMAEKISDFEFVDKSEEFLEGLQKDEMNFVILCIDIAGSTKLSSSLDPKINARIISLFSREMSAIVPLFNGYVLKHVGDGLIAYFPEPNFIGQNDNAVDCALTMRLMVLEGLNTVLKGLGFPELSIRIGVDSGEAVVTITGDSSSKQQKDLIGFTINLATKIQSKAQPNQLVIGGTTARNLHVNWRKRFQKFVPDQWDYGNYPLYAFTD